MKTLIHSMALLAALIAVSPSAEARMGGFMSSCYNGYFIADRVCEHVSSRGGVEFSPGRSFEVRAIAEGRYEQSNGENMRFDISINLEDPTNYFDPEGQLPILVRVISSGYHRDYSYSVKSMPLILQRHEGQRSLGTNFSITLHNGFGAEYVEYLEKIEVLIPGATGVMVLGF